MLASRQPLFQALGMEGTHLGCEGMAPSPDLNDRMGSPSDMVHLLAPSLSETEKTDLQSDLSLDFDTACPESSKFDPDSVLGAGYLERAAEQGAMSDCLTEDPALDLPVSVGSFDSGLTDFDVNTHRLDGQLAGMGTDLEDSLPEEPRPSTSQDSNCQPAPERPAPMVPGSAPAVPPPHSASPIKLQLVNTSPVVIGNVHASNFVNTVLANKAMSPLGGGIVMPAPTVAMVPGFIILSPLSNFVSLIKPMPSLPAASVNCRANLVVPSYTPRSMASMDDFVVSSKPGLYVEELPDPLAGEESSSEAENCDMNLSNRFSPGPFTSQTPVDSGKQGCSQLLVPSVATEALSSGLNAGSTAALGCNEKQQSSHATATAITPGVENLVTDISSGTGGQPARKEVQEEPMETTSTSAAETKKTVRVRKSDGKPRKKRGPRLSRVKKVDAEQGRTFEVFIKTTVGAEEVVSVGEDSRSSAASEDTTPPNPAAPAAAAAAAAPAAAAATTTASADAGPVPVAGAGAKHCGDGRPFKCNLCSASFLKLGGYTRHRMIHNVRTESDFRYKCDVCDRTFLQRCDMKRHKLIHLQQEPYRCDVCGKGYIRRSDLIVHKRFHEKNKAYKCDQCDKRFYQTGDLNRHVRQVHLKCPTLTCGHCHRKYAKEATLLRHMQAQHRDIILTSISHAFAKQDENPKSKPEEKPEEKAAEESTSSTSS